MAFRISSNAFSEGGTIPRLHTCEGADVSPSLEWTDPPEGTASFALIVDDPDAPSGTWTHWLFWDIPPSTRTLPQGNRDGLAGTSGVNDFGRRGYGGPCPPKGHGPHRYYFRLYALNTESLGISEDAKRAEVDRAFAGKVIAETVCMGRYERH